MNPDLTHHKLHEAKFLKSQFSKICHWYPNLNSFFQDFPQELDFNILIHGTTHLYKHTGEEIVW